MVKILERITTESGLIVKGLCETQAELTADSACIAAAPGSEFEADDLSFYATKKLNGTWKIVATGL